MKAEVLALWCIWKVATVFGIVSLQVFGDSRVTIKWATCEFNLQVITLTPWCKRIEDMINYFLNINFQHIFREHNQLENQLSKETLDGEIGILLWEEVTDNT